MDRLTDWRLVVPHGCCFGAGNFGLQLLWNQCIQCIYTIHIYIYILQQCCLIVIIYDAIARIFFFFKDLDVDLNLLVVLYDKKKSNTCLIYMICSL